MHLVIQPDWPRNALPWKGKYEHVSHGFQSVKKSEIGQVIFFSGISISSSESEYNIWLEELFQGFTPIALLDGVQEAE